MRRISTKKLLLLFLHVVLLLFFVYSTNKKQDTQPQVAGIQSSTSLTEKVIRVVDGDTFEIETGQKVRLIGINAPESVDPRKPVECFGKEASNELKGLIEGKSVRLEKDVSETDKYGRLLRYVYLNDNFINSILVKSGFAYSDTFPPDVKYQSLFRENQQEAMKNNVGLWGSCKK